MVFDVNNIPDKRNTVTRPGDTNSSSTNQRLFHQLLRGQTKHRNADEISLTFALVQFCDAV